MPGCELAAAKRASRRAQKVARSPGPQKVRAACAQGRHSTNPSALSVRNACNLLTANEGGRAAWRRASAAYGAWRRASAAYVMSSLQSCENEFISHSSINSQLGQSYIFLRIYFIIIYYNLICSCYVQFTVL